MADNTFKVFSVLKELLPAICFLEQKSLLILTFFLNEYLKEYRKHSWRFFSKKMDSPAQLQILNDTVSLHANTFVKGMNRFLILSYFIIQRVKTREIPYPHQQPTRSDIPVSMAKAVRPPLAPPAVFAT